MCGICGGAHTAESRHPEQVAAANERWYGERTAMEFAFGDHREEED